MPALVQFINARAGELPFDDQPRYRRLIVTSDSDYFISHALKPCAICLPRICYRTKGNQRRVLLVATQSSILSRIDQWR